MTTPANVNMSALIAWARTFKPPPCAEGIERAEEGWKALNCLDREWIAYRCGPELHELLSRDPIPFVREVVATRCGLDLLKVLAKDPFRFVREAVAEHCGWDLLEVLAADPDAGVREIAAKRLKELR